MVRKHKCKISLSKPGLPLPFIVEYRADMSEISPAQRSVSRIVLVMVLMALGVAGCAKLSASHLQLKPWADGSSQKLNAKFLHFDFQTLPQGDKYEVKGAAWPVRENLPEWADTVENLSITAYLCDENGNVLAISGKNFQVQKIPASGFSFDLLLKPGTLASGGYFVTFGYRCMFTASKPSPAGSPGSGSVSGTTYSSPANRLLSPNSVSALSHSRLHTSPNP